MSSESLYELVVGGCFGVQLLNWYLYMTDTKELCMQSEGAEQLTCDW